MFTYALGEENLLRDECHVGTELRCLQKLREITSTRKLTSTRGDVNGIQARRVLDRVLRERNRLDYSHFSNKLCSDLDWLAAKFAGKKRARFSTRPFRFSLGFAID